MTTTNFDEFATEYETLLDRNVALSGEDSAYFTQYKALYLSKLLGPGFQGKILDYGCGVGMLSRLLRKHLPAAKIHGFDVSAEGLRMIGDDLKNQGIFTTDCNSLHTDYEVAIVSNVMHHVPKKDRQETAAGIAARLVHQGKLVIFEHNPLNPLTRWVVSQCPFDKDAVLLRPQETAKYLNIAGVPPVRRDYIVFFPRMFSMLRFLEPRLAWCPAGAQYAMVGVKHGA